MPRTLKEAPLTTPNARRGLQPGLYWRSVSADVHLGYQKGKRAGRWVVRWRLPAGWYHREGIGAADDGMPADGIETLNFEQARRKAAETVDRKRLVAKAEMDGPVPTVRSAVDAYVERRDAKEVQRHGQDAALRRDARRRLARHVLADPIADVLLHDLSDDDLMAWRGRLPANLATSSVRRIVNDFKAALNAAGKKGRKLLPADFAASVKAGLKAEEDEVPEARDGAALPDADIRRIIDAAIAVDAEDEWGGDLSRFVIALAATGARFSQQARMRVADVQPGASSRLMVPVSFKGRGQKKVSHVGVAVGSDVIDALRPAFAGRRPGEWLFERWRHKQEPARDNQPPKWVRDTRGPWRASAEIQRPWAAIIKRAGLPASTVAYGLRHSSIVRGLRAGLPVRLVAKLHDTSTAMIERHYSASINDALDDLATAAVVPLVSEPGKVIPLRAGMNTNPQG